MLRARLQTLALAAVTLSLTAAAPLGTPLRAQIHRVQRSEPVTRAVAVYEYSGDLKKPTSARLIPVSLFIGGHFENAGSYLARPIPFALDTGNIYELQHAGEPLGTLDLAFAKNLRGSSAEVTVPFDVAWFGYGRFSPEKAPSTSTASKSPARHTQHAYAVQDDGKPHFGGTPADSSQAKPQTSSRNPRDTTDVDPDADRTQRVSLPDDNRDPNAPNADRPTLRRRPEDTTGGPKTKRPKETASVTAAGAGPDKDPDRPTMKRKSAGDSEEDVPPDPSEVSSTKSVHGSAGTVSAASTAAASGVIADNGRPELRRNTAASATAPAVTQAASMPDLQKVAAPSLPPDLQLTVAVSDPKNRPTHDFSTPFASETERAAAMGEMRTLALAVLHDPALATDAPAFAPAGAARPAAPVAAAARTRTSAAAHRTSAARKPTATLPRKPASTATIAGNTLQNEQIAAYTLSYSAPLTYVYTAQTAPSGASPVRFVSVVAQRNADGKLDIGLRTVTDTAHLDRTPRYRLVDAVDADASNRADLLFELRSQASRQFALYRYLGPRPDQVFVSDTTK
ncbi:hypothetical protein [Terriglobus sp.]|uniref:hypothetical protein n=1 Tax=Terriglobus sp. TaxID=1889013 RepID=UPI003AFFEBD7